MTKLHPFTLSLLVIMLFGVMTLSDAYALQYYNGGGWSNCPVTGSFTGLVVECVKLSVNTITNAFLTRFTAIMLPIIGGMITLSIVLYGVQVLMGEPEIIKTGLKMLIRNGAVLWFADNLGGFGPAVLDSMQYILDMVTNSISDVGVVFSCPVNLNSIIKTLISTAQGTSLVWNRLDCIVEKLFGVGEGTALASSLFGMIYTLLFGGTFGILAFVLGMATLLSLMFYVFRIVYAFILSYIFVGFLIGISPLMIAMLIFPTMTGAMFEKWWKNLLAGMALPAMLMAYMSVSILLIDAALFANNVSLGKVITDEQILKAHRKKQQFCQWQTASDKNFYKNFTPEGQSPQDYISGPMKNFLVPMMSGSSDLCEYFDFPTMDFSRRSDNKLHTEVMLDIVLSLFVAYIVIGLVVGMFGVFSSVTTGIFGGGSALVQALKAPMPGEGEAKQMAMGAAGGMKNIAGGSSGVGNMLKSAVKR